MWTAVCSTASVNDSHEDSHWREALQLSTLWTEVPAFILAKQSQVRDTCGYSCHKVDRASGASRTSRFAGSRIIELLIQILLEQKSIFLLVKSFKVEFHEMGWTTWSTVSLLFYNYGTSLYNFVPLS